MKISKNIISFLFVGFLILQFFRPKDIDRGTPMKHLAGVPDEVGVILKTSCFDCHSSETDLRWYDKITPANFLVASHIRKGRKTFDFSKWDSLPQPKRNAMLYYSINKVLSGEMPIPNYTAIHRSAKLNDLQIRTLKNYALTLSPRKISKTESEKNVNRQMDIIKTIQEIKPSPNGIQYIPDYRNWKVISTTDRFDNGTMRIIFGNDVAVRAIENHETEVWPDGTIFAKAAWKQAVQSDGSVTAGDFVQVEFMIKNARKYSRTNGWGWARWLGKELNPYGKKPDFDQECMACHLPMKDQDHVFTSPLYLISQLEKLHK